VRVPLEKVDEFEWYEPFGQKRYADTSFQEHFHRAIGDFVDFIDCLKCIGSGTEGNPGGNLSLPGKLPFQDLREIMVEMNLSRRGRTCESPRVAIDTAVDAAPREIDGGRVLETAEGRRLQDRALAGLLDDFQMMRMLH
jgi:hypothetical protein